MQRQESIRLQSEFPPTEDSHEGTVEVHVITEEGSEVVPLLDATAKYCSKSVTRDEFVRINWEMAHVGPQSFGKLVFRNHTARIVSDYSF